MAVLDNASRDEVNFEFQRDGAHVSFGAVTKADIRAAVNALDDFLNTNATTINNAIPQPARAQLTTTQKAMLLRYVIAKRYIKGV